MFEGVQHPRLLKLGFGAGALGTSLSFGAVPLLFLFYLTEFAHVPPATAGVLLALPKLADMVLDPWIGRRTDAVARRLGSRSGLLALGMAVLPVLLVLLFMPLQALPLPARIGLLAVLLVAQSLVLTVYTVAYTALASDIAQGMAGRSSLMSARALGQTLAGLTVSAAAPQLVAAFGAGQGGYLGMAAVLAAAALLAMVACWLAVRRVKLVAGTDAGPATPLWRALRGTLKNRAFYCVAALLVLLGLSLTALMSALPYVNQHLLHAGPQNLSVLLTPLFLTVLVGISVAPWLARHAQPALVLGAALAVAVASIVAMGLAPRGNAAVASGCAVFGLASGVLTVMISTLAIESATHFAKQGESLGLYLGILSTSEKLGQSLGGVIVGFGLDWVGPLQAQASPQSLSRLETLWIAAPAGTLLVALLLLAPLTTRLRSS